AIATYVLHVSTTASGGPETQSILVTDTFPSGVTPHASGAGGTGWVCSVSGQKDTCTHAVAAALAPGTILPPLSMPVTVDAPGGTTINDVAAVSSNDVFPVSVSAAFVIPGISVPMTGAAQSPLASTPAGLILILAGVALAGAEVGLGIRRSLRRRSAL
ncbi:MAG TPA: hypothetical protein VNU19_14945, partial [Candidatus Acidoferrum sp.]|nr:hypothetical protein [Candidatus Acidoferrum sp.]